MGFVVKGLLVSFWMKGFVDVEILFIQAEYEFELKGFVFLEVKGFIEFILFKLKNILILNTNNLLIF